MQIHPWYYYLWHKMNFTLAKIAQIKVRIVLIYDILQLH
jgi:hypothetical protein